MFVVTAPPPPPPPPDVGYMGDDSAMPPPPEFLTTDLPEWVPPNYMEKGIVYPSYQQVS